MPAHLPPHERETGTDSGLLNPVRAAAGLGEQAWIDAMPEVEGCPGAAEDLVARVLTRQAREVTA